MYGVAALLYLRALDMVCAGGLVMMVAHGEFWKSEAVSLVDCCKLVRFYMLSLISYSGLLCVFYSVDVFDVLVTCVFAWGSLMPTLHVVEFSAMFKFYVLYQEAVFTRSVCFSVVICWACGSLILICLHGYLLCRKLGVCFLNRHAHVGLVLGCGLVSCYLQVRARFLRFALHKLCGFC
eukprot:gene2629-1627_t